MKKIFISILILICVMSFYQIYGNTVYVVMSCDTSIWRNTSGEDDAFTYENEFDFDVFSNPAGVYRDVMDDTFRLSHTDSDGNPFKFSWYMHGGGWFQYGKNLNAIGTTYLIKKYWGNDLIKWGDELTYHFHHYIWSGTDWRMANAFSDCIWDFDWTLSQMMLDEDVFPISYRAGWLYMDNDYQTFLDKWLPFRLDAGSWMADCTPYHPSYTNYKTAGDMKGWEARCYYMKDFSTTVANTIFSNASLGKPQVVCIWSHQNEADFVSQIEFVDTNLHSAALAHPDVKFLYYTDKEAMNAYTQTDDMTPPKLEIDETKTGVTSTLSIHTDEDIYEVMPWIAARKYTGEYVRLDATKISEGEWQCVYPNVEIDKIGAGVMDINGNVATKILNDGSYRWQTQSDFYYSSPDNLNVDAKKDSVALDYITTSVITQAEQDSQSDIIKRSYWVAQSFIPKSSSISKIVIAATVTTPSEFRVELRPINSGGYPSDDIKDVLTSATASISVSGNTTANLVYSGLSLDGRKYAIVVKGISGSAKLRMSTLNPYADGMLMRAYSLAWISVSAYDLLFQIYDGGGGVSIDQSTSNNVAYTSEPGYFVMQTVKSDFASLNSIEVFASSVSANDIISLQLRKTDENGMPDFSEGSLLASGSVTVVSPGAQVISLNYTVPDDINGKNIAFVFLCPQTGLNSAKLGYSSNDSYKDGMMFVSYDLTNMIPKPQDDLYFVIHSNGYVPNGILLMTFDAKKKALFTKAKLQAESITNNALIKYRLRFADSMSEIQNSSWSQYYTDLEIPLTNSNKYNIAQAEITLLSLNQAETPILKSFEIFYDYSIPSSSMNNYFMLY